MMSVGVYIVVSPLRCIMKFHRPLWLNFHSTAQTTVIIFAQRHGGASSNLYCVLSCHAASNSTTFRVRWLTERMASCYDIMQIYSDICCKHDILI